MSRWAPDAAGRLYAAALELFLERGFSETTVPQIAERAGLTTRSFFRYFADKREVLFVGEDELPGVVEQIFAAADAAMTPMQVIDMGLRTVVFLRFEQYRDELLRRRAVVLSDEGLQERELRKHSILHKAAASAFLRRGLNPMEANIAGRLAVIVYDTTLDLWLASEAAESLDAILSSVVHALSRVAQPYSPELLTPTAMELSTQTRS